MALATGGRVDAAAGGLSRRVRLTLSVVAANAANFLTVARLCCALPIVLLVLGGDYHNAALLFLLAAASDGLDGYIAKRFNAVTSAIAPPASNKKGPTQSSVVVALRGGR